MKPLRIAFVVDRFGRRYGGAEAYGVALMRELSARHEITVFAREYDTECGVALNWTRMPAWGRWPSWLRVLFTAHRAARLTAGRFDIVHSHSNGWAGDVEVVHVTPVRYNWRCRVLSLGRRLTARLSARVRTYLWLESRRVAPRAAHAVVAVSDLIAQQLHAAYGAALPVSIIAPGVDLPAPMTEALAQARTALRASLGLDDDAVVAILVARNPLRKGLQTALRTWASLPSHYHLLVVGSDAAMMRSIRALPQAAAVAQRLHLIPATPDVAPYYRAADLCIHPTRNDSFGMAPLEAMAFGLPVIISPPPWCGFAAALESGRDALLLPTPDDAAALAQAVRAVASDGALRARLVAGGHARARQHAWPAVAAQYEAVYAKVLAERLAQTQPRSQ